LIEEKVESENSVMEGMTMGPVNTEDLGTAGSFLEIDDVVFGKLLAQVEADHVKLRYIAHVLSCTFPDLSSSLTCRRWFPFQRLR
jgi:hypothetical protein